VSEPNTDTFDVEAFDNEVFDCFEPEVIVISDVRMTTPRLQGAAMTTPDVQSVEMTTPTLHEVTMTGGESND
jgi:hypothetical protein